MARLEYINFKPMREVIHEGTLIWENDGISGPIDGLPQIFWGNGEGWAEANHWALEKATTPGIKVKSVSSLMKHLHQYASFLDKGEQRLDWRHFPIRLAERVVVRFRGYLMTQIEKGYIASSTGKSRMNAVIQFYRHALAHGFVSLDSPMWTERVVVLPFYDSVGFKRAMVRVSTDLSIPNTRLEGGRLEDGLLPLSEVHMTRLLEFATREQNNELQLILTVGFFTGGRIGTITTIRIENIEQALPDPYIKGFYLIRVGPGTGVATKFDVEGDLFVPAFLLTALKAYAYSVERLKREAKATFEDRTILFLTIRGRPYSGNTINRLMTDLRREAILAGLKFMANFKFHQTRATYGTWLMKLMLRVTTVPAAIEFVKNAMLHKHESTTFKYVKFIEVSKGKEAVAIAFSQVFTGLEERNWNDFDA